MGLKVFDESFKPILSKFVGVTARVESSFLIKEAAVAILKETGGWQLPNKHE